MEVLADTQLELHRRERTDLCRHGVWGLVRHPKYVLWREGCNCYMDLLMIVQLSGRHIDSFLFHIA
jgi:steroid 5-alpha reductase family enzyme